MLGGRGKKDEKSLLSPEDGGSKRNKNATSKTRVGVLLRQPFQKSSNQNEQLIKLKERYQQMCQQLKVLGKALNQRHQALVHTAKSRVAVAKAFSAMGAVEGSPMSDHTGSWSVEDDAATGPPPSYTHCMSIIDLQAESRASEFKAFALDYFVDWQETVTTRINADIKKTDQYRQDADHYKTKVESLAAGKKRLEEKKRPVPDSTLEKLRRNQEKLEEATIVYNAAALDLFLLMEELVDRAWRDLYPLFLAVLQWDIETTQDDSSVVKDLKEMVEKLKELQDTQKISRNRMPEVAKESAKNLSTRPEGVDAVDVPFGGGDHSNSSEPGKVVIEEVTPLSPPPPTMEDIAASEKVTKSATPATPNPFDDDDDDDDGEEEDQDIPQFNLPKEEVAQFDPTKIEPDNNNPFDDDDDDDDDVAPGGGDDKNPFSDDDGDGKNPFDDDDEEAEGGKALRRPSN